MGRGKNGLQHLGGTLALQGIEHQRHDDRQGEANQEALNTQQECVFHQIPELDIREKRLEVVEAYPDGGVGKDLVTGHKILERDQNTVDRQIVEQENHHNGRQNHE